MRHTKLHAKRLVGTLLLALASAACSQGEESAPAQQQEVVDVEKLEHVVDLQATGLAVPPQGGEEQLDVPFGSRMEAAEATLAGVLGDKLASATNAECPAGPVESSSYEGLTLNFQDGGFVGWMAEAPYLPRESRAQLLASDTVTLVEGSTLGEEFVIGNPDGLSISGLFDAVGDDAKVSRMWAGVNCIFR